MNFIPIKTRDNTISLYNYEVNDVYHSKVGAYTEAIHKYVLPSGLLSFINGKSEVKLLDVCYGLGYNTKAAVNEIIKFNPEINIQLTALEIDPVVLAFSTIIGNECFSDDVNIVFYNAISKQINIQQTLDSYVKSQANICPHIKSKIQSEYELISEEEINAKLHNIYYMSIHQKYDFNKHLLHTLTCWRFIFSLALNILLKSSQP